MSGGNCSEEGPGLGVAVDSKRTEVAMDMGTGLRIEHCFVHELIGPSQHADGSDDDNNDDF